MFHLSDMFVWRPSIWVGFVDNLKWGRHVLECMSCATNVNVSPNVFSTTYFLWAKSLHLCKTNVVMYYLLV
jgi:hypothetical protein